MFRFRQALAATALSTVSLLALCALESSAPVANAQSPAALAPAGRAPAKATPSDARYVVSAGDYLTGIAAKLGVRVSDLLAVNHLVITSVIHPGQTLVVPAGGKPPAITPAPAAAPTAAPTALAPSAPTDANSVYVVKSGDYLISIALNHGVKLSALLAANKIKVTTAIHPGTKLTIPPATMPIPAPKAATVPAPATIAVTPDTTPTTAPATTPTTAAPVTPAPAPTSQQQATIATVLSYLQAQIGKPYQFNAAGPDFFDCSGLSMAAYAQIGVSLPHQSLMQSTYGVAVDWKTQPILPGDLVFMFSSSNPTVISHVGVAVDSKNWIQAARSGTPVRMGPLPSNDRIQAVRRIVTG